MVAVVCKIHYDVVVLELLVDGTTHSAPYYPQCGNIFFNCDDTTQCTHKEDFVFRESNTLYLFQTVSTVHSSQYWVLRKIKNSK